MNARLETVFKTLENQRHQVFSLVEKIPEHQFNINKNGKWSVAQILTHLLTSERMSYMYMKKKSQGISELDNTGLKESLVMVLLKVSQRLPLKFKAPGIVIEKTPEALSLQDLKTDWDKLRRNMKSFLEEFDDNTIRKMVYKHPVGGRLNVVQALEFFYEHMNHHLPQIKKIINS